jgi:hypothetical protein
MNKKLSPTQQKQLDSFLKPASGSKRKLIALVTGNGSAYAAIQESDKNSAGQFLVALPSTGASRVLLSDTTLLPLEARLVPPLIRQQFVKKFKQTERKSRKPGAEAPAINPHTLMHGLMSVLANHGVALAAAPGPVAASDVNQAVYDSVLNNVNVLSSANIDGTENGVLGCAWAVNEVVRQALGHPISGDNLLSTIAVHDALVNGQGNETDQGDATHGSIIISPTEGDNIGHVGILGDGGLIYSNRSADGLFSQNYDLDTWNARYKNLKGLQVLFYNLNP